MSDNLENKTDKLAGKAKEALGAATDDESLKQKGRNEQTKADVKDAVGDAVDAVKDRFKKED